MIANGGIEENVRVRNVVILIKFDARADREELQRVVRAIARTSVGLVEETNAQSQR